MGQDQIIFTAEGMRYIFANPDLLKAPPYGGQYAGRLTLRR